jgi:aspartyl-tRNA(Asn)/glutamyl-tRNA(Gln) amidotransferase subunit A
MSGLKRCIFVGWVAYTYPVNLCGLPAASVPCGFTRAGLLVGLQIVSKALHETDILRAAAAFEAARPWSHRKPVAHEPRATAAAEPARIGT